MKCDRRMLRLYAVTDRAWVGSGTLEQQVEAALKGGATCVQLREKGMNEDELLQEALRMKEICRRYGVPLIINDHVEVALRAGADGVHVGQQDMPIARVRELAGDRLMVGVSARTVEQALEAERGGADYLGAGAVFGTSTKQDARFLPYETLQAICRAVSIPVCAIGGINRENMLRLKGSGIAGAAVVSAIFGAPSVEQACRELRALSEEVSE